MSISETPLITYVIENNLVDLILELMKDGRKITCSLPRTDGCFDPQVMQTLKFQWELVAALFKLPEEKKNKIEWSVYGQNGIGIPYCPPDTCIGIKDLPDQIVNAIQTSYPHYVKKTTSRQPEEKRIFVMDLIHVIRKMYRKEYKTATGREMMTQAITKKKTQQLERQQKTALQCLNKHSGFLERIFRPNKNKKYLQALKNDPSGLIPTMGKKKMKCVSEFVTAKKKAQQLEQLAEEKTGTSLEEEQRLNNEQEQAKAKQLQKKEKNVRERLELYDLIVDTTMLNVLQRRHRKDTKFSDTTAFINNWQQWKELPRDQRQSYLNMLDDSPLDVALRRISDYKERDFLLFAAIQKKTDIIIKNTKITNALDEASSTYNPTEKGQAFLRNLFNLDLFIENQNPNASDCSSSLDKESFKGDYKQIHIKNSHNIRRWFSRWNEEDERKLGQLVKCICNFYDQFDKSKLRPVFVQNKTDPDF